MGKGIAVRVYGRRILRIESNSRGGREILDGGISLPFDPVFPRKAAATATRKGLEIRCAPGVINIHVHAVLTVQ